jgi:hypothetical protein
LIAVEVEAKRGLGDHMEVELVEVESAALAEALEANPHV